VNIEEWVLDSEKVEDGVWQEIDDAKVLIGRAFSRRYAECLQKNMEERREEFLDASADGRANEITEEALAKTMAEATLLGWENMKFRDQVIPYSPEAAYVILKNVSWFRERIWRMAQLREPYMAHTDGNALGNLLASFVGTTGGGSETETSSTNSSD
jgi:hypothetical protein